MFDKLRTWNRRRIQRHRLRKPAVETALGFRFSGLAEMISGDWEKSERRVISHLLDNVDLFVDVGAHYGFYVCLAQKHGVETVAIEPVASNLSMIAKNLRANGWGGDVTVLPVAAGHDRGFFEIRGGGSGGTLDTEHSRAPKSQVQSVPVVRIEDVIDLKGRRALFLVDVEGFELQALKGATALLTADPKPVWMIEIFVNHIGGDRSDFRDDYAEIMRLMSSLGYEIYFFGEDLTKFDLSNLLKMFDENDPNTPSGNFVFIAPGAEELVRGL